MYTKQDLIQNLCSGATPAFPTKTEAERAVNGVIDGIKALCSAQGSEGVNLSGFGAFRKVVRAARMGKNPKTGEAIQIKESRSVGFRVSKVFRDTLA